MLYSYHQCVTYTVSWHDTRLTANFQDSPVSRYQNLSIPDFIGAKDDGGGDDNGAVRRAIVTIKINTRLFRGRMPFPSPNQQCRSTEGQKHHVLSSPGLFQPCIWPLKAADNLRGGLSNLSPAFSRPYCIIYWCTAKSRMIRHCSTGIATGRITHCCLSVCPSVCPSHSGPQIFVQELQKGQGSRSHKPDEISDRHLCICHVVNK